MKTMPFTRWKLAVRGLVHFRRHHLGVLLGTALSGAILSGALIVGDSVRFSLTRLATLRLGQTEFAVSSADRFFRADLSSELHADHGWRIAPVLHLPGTASLPDRRLRANRVQVLGVDRRFWELAPEQSGFRPGPEEAIVNRRLAARLSVRAGDTLVVRVEKPSILPRDAPLGHSPGRSLRPLRRALGTLAGTSPATRPWDAPLGRLAGLPGTLP